MKRIRNFWYDLIFDWELKLVTLLSVIGVAILCAMIYAEYKYPCMKRSQSVSFVLAPQPNGGLLTLPYNECIQRHK